MSAHHSPHAEALAPRYLTTCKLLANDLVALLCQSVITPVVNRTPNRREVAVLSSLQASLTQRYDEQLHRPMLEELWKEIFMDANGVSPPFQRYSRKWCHFGFQQKDPTADIRGGGELSLDVLLYMLKTHRPLVARIFRAHRRRTQQRGPYANYPFACAAITITRKLCEVLCLVRPHAGPTGEYEVTPKHFWASASTKAHFLELACCTFSLLDQTWDAQNASYMQFSTVIATTMTTLVDSLNRLPVGVTPSALSFTPASMEDYMTLDASINETATRLEELGLNGGGNEDEEIADDVDDVTSDGKEEGEENKQGHQGHAPDHPMAAVNLVQDRATSLHVPVSVAREAEPEPLLDLSDFETPNAASQPNSRPQWDGPGVFDRPCDKATRPMTPDDFFESFGLPS